MARLIIGHVADNKANIWVRGEKKHPVAFIRVQPGDKTVTILLEERHGYTGSVEIDGLQPNTDYICDVEFAKTNNTVPHQRIDFGHCRGRFTTAPKDGEDAAFNFILGSCNLHSLGFIADPDPAYEELLDRAIKQNARFMVHCGDQIYYDIPNPAKSPDVEEYRDKYLDAWGDSRPTRKFLTQLPQYMIMDDHEITNNFANDMFIPSEIGTPETFRLISMKVYREFVHIRQPNSYGRQALYYDFAFGKNRFFVMDCRTERRGFSGPENQIIGDSQMTAFKNWLLKYKDQLKFVVTSVPFIMGVKNDKDKWSAPAFEHQRDEVIDHLASNDIGKLVFLTGDMHASYHSKMAINDKLEIHELMSSPINQLQKTGIDEFKRKSDGQTEKGNSYSGRIAKFYSNHSNAMMIGVNQNELSYQIFRTKKSKIVRSGSFTPA
jgi:phosphodiesterase/alkaline phosphatase D-like protein